MIGRYSLRLYSGDSKAFCGVGAMQAVMVRTVASNHSLAFIGELP